MKVFLSGAMTGLTYEESNKWRFEINKYFYDESKVEVFNPVEKNKLSSEQEAMRYDLDKLSMADLVIVNFTNPHSIGTAFELGYAYKRRIPIIGLNENDQYLHPWLKSVCVHIFTDMNEMLDFVNNYYVTY